MLVSPGRSLGYAVLLLAACVIGLIEATQSYLRAELQGRAFSWRIGLLDALPSWIILAALVPGVVWVARRARLDRGPTGSAVAIHLLAALGFALTHETLMAFISAWRWNDPRYGLYIWKMATAYLALDFVVYWGIVGGYHAFDYSRELRRRELAASQLQASLSEARLQALRAQLNPHFLFNTLNVISVLAMKGESARVTRTLSLLGDLLRLTIDGALPQEVPLSRELELTDRYLEIQRVRFPDRLTVDRDVPPDAYSALVPSLILQPLVENAVVHGISRQAGAGRITVRARRLGGDLELQVCDTGPGFSGEHPKDGIGLSNTRARLEQLYGGAQHVACRNTADGACTVVVLPFRTAGEGSAAWAP